MTSYIEKIQKDFDDKISGSFWHAGSYNAEARKMAKTFLTKALQDYKAHLLEEVKEKMPKMLTAYTEKKFEFIDYEAREYNKALSEVIKVLNEI